MAGNGGVYMCFARASAGSIIPNRFYADAQTYIKNPTNASCNCSKESGKGVHARKAARKIKKPVT